MNIDNFDGILKKLDKIEDLIENMNCYLMEIVSSIELMKEKR